MTTLAPLTYNGEIIHQRDEMLSLTDMWKAAGRPTDRGPSDWLRTGDGERFVDFLSGTLNIPEPGNNRFGLIKVAKGGSTRGSTLAHWQIGLAYAKYLSPEFHMWCNTVVRERMVGKTHDTHLPADVMEMFRRTDGIVRMLSHKVTEMEKANATLLAAASATSSALTAISAIVQPSHPILIRHGLTAGQIWHANGFPPIKITCWFSNRLSEIGCRMEGCADMGLRKVRLFDPDKADLWLKNGGRLMVEQKIAERMGQGKLRLVPTPPQPSSVQ
jgi:hypothetical protein